MNVRIFWVRVMKYMCAQTRPRFILSSERVFGGMEFEPMLSPREKSPVPENFPRGWSNLRRCGQRAQTLPMSYSGPLVGLNTVIFAKISPKMVNPSWGTQKKKEEWNGEEDVVKLVGLQLFFWRLSNAELFCQWDGWQNSVTWSNSFEWEYRLRSSLCTHAFHCMGSKDPDIHALTNECWLKTTPACTIHEDGMWLPQWLDWKMVTYAKISPKNGEPQR